MKELKTLNTVAYLSELRDFYFSSSVVSNKGAILVIDGACRDNYMPIMFDSLFYSYKIDTV